MTLGREGPMPRPNGRARADLAPAGNGIDPTQLDTERMRAELLDVEAVSNLPPPEPLVGDVLLQDSVAVLYGKPGCGKSFVALDWALCVGTGLPWQGRDVRGGPVLYVAAEGLRGLGRRVQAWRQAFQGAPWPPRVAFFPRPVNLLDQRQAATLIALAGQEQYALVVIDTFNRSLVGGDENSSRDVGLAVDIAVQTQHASEGTVLFLHHMGRNEAIRGHSSLDGGVDTMIEARAEDDNGLVLKAVKQKDAEEFDPILLRREVVALGDGSTSCVIRSRRFQDTAETLTNSEQRLLAVLRECFASTGARTTAWLEATELPKSSFYRARESLVGKGLVVSDSHHGHPLYRPADEGTAPGQ
jgi:hypothetical protein